MKAMMVHVILNYDIKAEVDGVKPPNVYMGDRIAPNPKAKVWLKKRSRVEN